MKRKFYLLRFVLALAILIILIHKVGSEKILDTMSSANLIYPIFIIPIWIVILLLGTYNLLIFLRALKLKIHFSKLFRYYLLSWSTGLFLPGKVGELIILKFFKNEQINYGQSSAIYFTDKIVTGFVLLLFSSMGLFLLLGSSYLTFYGVLFLALAFIVFVSIIASKKTRNLVKKYILRKYSHLFEGFSKILISLFKDNKEVIFINLIITIIKASISAVAISLLFLSFNQPVNFFYIIIIDSLITIISFIPISFNGLGLKESSAVILYSLVGINPVITASSYILGTVLTYLMGFIIFIIIKMEKFL